MVGYGIHWAGEHATVPDAGALADAETLPGANDDAMLTNAASWLPNNAHHFTLCHGFKMPRVISYIYIETALGTMLKMAQVDHKYMLVYTWSHLKSSQAVPHPPVPPLPSMPSRDMALACPQNASWQHCLFEYGWTTLQDSTELSPVLHIREPLVVYIPDMPYANISRLYLSLSCISPISYHLVANIVLLIYILHIYSIL